MIVTKKTIPRRTVLRGIGTAVALPLLDGMVPALAAIRNTAAQPVPRLGVVYVPNGMVMDKWTPEQDGAAFELPPIMQPLAEYRDQVLVLTGLSCIPPEAVPGGGNHARASTRFLTDVPPRHTQNSQIGAGTSMDQFAAAELGQHTQLASLELSLDGRDFSGSCDVGFSCVYTNTISWRGPATPLPTENDPRAMFERLFGDSDTTDQVARRARMREDRSILDAVTDKAAAMQARLGPGDQLKLTEYLDGIRDVERRIQIAETQSIEELPLVDRPAGIPRSYEEHAKLLFDLQVLAYQTDLTRVMTCMMGRELTGRSYPELGVSGAHHPISHHQRNAQKLADLQKINTFHMQLFAYYLDKLRATPDGDGSLFDHVLLLYGAGMADSNQHAHMSLPIMLTGGAGGQLEGGRHLRYPEETPLANLHLTLLEKLGVHLDAIGDSTGQLDHLTGV